MNAVYCLITDSSPVSFHLDSESMQSERLLSNNSGCVVITNKCAFKERCDESKGARADKKEVVAKSVKGENDKTF